LGNTAIKDLDLAFLLEIPELQQVCIGVHETVLHFGAILKIVIWTPCEVRAPDQSTRTWIPEQRNDMLMFWLLLESRITSYLQPNNDELRLMFANNHELLLRVDKEFVESFMMTLENGRTIIV
jgi:hypothetical protein